MDYEMIEVDGLPVPVTPEQAAAHRKGDESVAEQVRHNREVLSLGYPDVGSTEEADALLGPDYYAEDDGA